MADTIAAEQESQKRKINKLFARLDQVLEENHVFRDQVGGLRDEVADLKTSNAVLAAKLDLVLEHVERQGAASERCMSLVEALASRVFDPAVLRWLVALAVVVVVGTLVIAGAGVTVDRAADGSWSFGAAAVERALEQGDGATMAPDSGVGVGPDL